MTPTTASLLCTRPEGERDPLVTRLRELGHRVHAAATVVVEPLPFVAPRLDACDWVVLTSAAGVHALLDRVPAPPGAVRWAVVGPATERALRERGLTASAMPAESRGARIVEAIERLDGLAGRRVLLARADAAATDLPEALRAAGALVDDVAVYHTIVGPDRSRPAVASALADPQLAAVLFASGSAVKGLLRLADSDPRRIPAVTIGPATTGVARASGFAVVAEAESPSVEGLAQAVTEYLGNRLPSGG